jgi:hypothetical protein
MVLAHRHDRADRGYVRMSICGGCHDQIQSLSRDRVELAEESPLTHPIGPRERTLGPLVGGLGHHEGMPERILARHADPRTTEHYDRARGNLDRHGVHFLTAYVAGV